MTNGRLCCVTLKFARTLCSSCPRRDGSSWCIQCRGAQDQFTNHLGMVCTTVIKWWNDVKCLMVYYCFTHINVCFCVFFGLYHSLLEIYLGIVSEVLIVWLYVIYHSIGSVPLLFVSTVLLHGWFLFFWCFWVEFLLSIQNCRVLLLKVLKLKDHPNLFTHFVDPRAVQGLSKRGPALRQLTPVPWCISRIVT